MKVLIVGSGLSGATCARVLADAGNQVKIIDERPNLGGNCYDSEITTANGINRVHSYGPHLFHTSNEAVWQFLSRFTEWLPYKHSVLAIYNNQHFSLPVNIDTIEKFFDLGMGTLTPDSARDFMAKITSQYQNLTVQTTEDLFLKSMGSELTEVFFRPYTEKMWGRPASELEAAVGSRLPIRYSRDSGYFLDKYQALPKHGYTELFKSMLSHPFIDLELNRAYDKSDSNNYDLTITSQPIDQFFDFDFGELPYRSINFELCIANKEEHPAPVINFTSTGPYTRRVRWSELPGHGDGHLGTVEKPVDWKINGQRYYPVRNQFSLAKLTKYTELAKGLGYVKFIGRLGQFKYQDMDAVCASAMLLTKSLLRQ